MSVSDTVGPADAPWDTPDPLTCVRQLQSLVGLCFNVGHESAGDLQTLIQSAMSGIRKEVDLHMDFMGIEHVEHKMDHQLQRKMVRFWKCAAVTLHESQTFYVGDTEPESDNVYYQWNKMKNLPGWWVKKIWHSYDGWLLVAKKEEFSLLVFDPPRQLDQRILVEETISSEGSIEPQRQTMVANMSKRALQTFLHLPKFLISSTKIPFPSRRPKQHGGCTPESNSKGFSTSSSWRTSKLPRPRWWSNYAYGYVGLHQRGSAHHWWLLLMGAYCRLLLKLYEPHFDSTKSDSCLACNFLHSVGTVFSLWHFNSRIYTFGGCECFLPYNSPTIFDASYLGFFHYMTWLSALLGCLFTCDHSPRFIPMTIWPG